jgi:acetyl-CoA carboxylase carboxyltransferase component
MAGPAFAPEATIALPTAQIAVMGPEAAVNAVHFNHIQELPPAERPAFIAAARESYRQDIDIRRLASELVVDGIVPPEELRGELVRRLEGTPGRTVRPAPKRHGVPPV